MKNFKKENGIIYVKNKIFRDRDLSYNYTKKAKDTIWLLEKNLSSKLANEEAIEVLAK